MNAAPALRTFRILLVEDNAADIYLMRKAMKDAGLVVELTIIEDGAEALACARRQGKYAGSPIPDLAILDLNLPKAGGAAILQAMRQNKDMSKVPVAITTSTAAPREQAKAEELGIERFITKPADLEAFLQIGYVLKELLERKPGPTSGGTGS